ncbi:MAG: hypothetical protein WCF10_12415, partial [Polyangiales bacterium]
MLHVELVTVELEAVVAHAFDLAFEPFAGHQLDPIERIAELDDVVVGQTRRRLCLHPHHAGLN